MNKKTVETTVETGTPRAAVLAYRQAIERDQADEAKLKEDIAQTKAEVAATPQERLKRLLAEQAKRHLAGCSAAVSRARAALYDTVPGLRELEQSLHTAHREHHNAAMRSPDPMRKMHLDKAAQAAAALQQILPRVISASDPAAAVQQMRAKVEGVIVLETYQEFVHVS